jgi:ribosomal-protein-alanine N-acetyltransferase
MSIESVIEIREMHLEDVQHVILIEREIFLFPWSIGNFSDAVKAGYVCRVLAKENSIVGYGIMMMSPEEAHILTLGVGVDWQKQGLGRMIIGYLSDYARSNNAKSILLDVRESNENAIKLYKKIGFEHIAIRKDYYPAMYGRENALVMKLIL